MTGFEKPFFDVQFNSDCSEVVLFAHYGEREAKQFLIMKLDIMNPEFDN